MIEMVTQKYYHTGGPGITVERISYAGGEVLVRHFPGERGKGAGPTALIVGFIEEGGYMQPQEDSVPVTTVRLITDTTQRRELTDLLIHRWGEKPINFLSP
ncbi:hypothetical protein HYX00_03980 [Candidatus Woesearchaeota archaeon]|nr:hypothetical protein [Candidatus Woesearchaeota archaeon]